MTTIILGAGIIGTSTAYYLSLTQSPSSIHLVEPSPTLFASASGFAGGFLAKDWFSPAVSSLGEFSFLEHRRLAEEHDGKRNWGYSKSSTTSYNPQKDVKTKKSGVDWLRHGASRAEAVAGSLNGLTSKDDAGPKWFTRIVGDIMEVISEEGSTAQVDPLRLSRYLLTYCIQRGVHLHHPAKAISVSNDIHGKLASVRVVSMDSGHEVEVPCTRILIAAGAWSPQVFQALFPNASIRLPVTSLAGHSLVLRSPRWTMRDEENGCHAVFTTDVSGYSPEIFSRLGGEIYIAGVNSSSIPLPELPTESKIEEPSILKLEAAAERLLGMPSDSNDLEIVRKGLCFRPVTDSGTPILARIPDDKLGVDMKTRGDSEGGVFLAAGHGPWGISMSVGTGKVMAEMIQGLPTSADVTELGF